MTAFSFASNIEKTITHTIENDFLHLYILGVLSLNVLHFIIEMCIGKKCVGNTFMYSLVLTLSA